MTKARLGFQPPLRIAPRSRKARTTAGSIIRETARPAPNSRPAKRAAKMRAIA
ncbi:hypothetical protein HQ394_16970 [Defluviicoccus vanus]|uniref:Uncharacterized protein n=1 Tax=Defluviicoccus vanus TaxID=111831 RepID=A0A7H1N4R8_9PROT|nr:hypothetical protein HQ394_16970 [Defluviicoccus vanus]